MRWWVVLLVLLLLPSVRALSISGCPTEVASGQLFSVTVSHNGAAYIGIDNGTGIVDSQAGDTGQLNLRIYVTRTHNNYKIYPAYKNTGDSTWQYDTSVFL